MGAWWCVPCMNFMVSTGVRCAGFGGCPPLVACSPLHRGIFSAGTGRNVAKVRFYLIALVFSRGSWRQQSAKSKYILESGVCVWCRVCLSWWCSIVSTGSICAGLRTFRTCLNAGSGPLVVFPPFCPLSRFACGALCLNMALFRVFRGFLGGFMGFVWVCAACVLCVACVAFVRVWS